MAGPSWASLVERAARIKPAGSDLEAVEHIVFLMLENRSYDHYFGAYPRGRGFDDHPQHSLGVFAQDYPGGSNVVPKNKLLPFHLSSNGLESTDDLTHDWGPMHECWNRGRMDSWVKVHTQPQWEGPKGALTMRYYTRPELPFHWALADQFTLGDAYHCSILGPTHPNRLMANSGTIDPAGTHGGPVVATNDTDDTLWNCSWTTVQELLEDKGISWKVYTPSNAGVSGKYASLNKYLTWDPSFYDPTVTMNLGLTDIVLPYFTAFRQPGTPLFEKAFKQTFPNDLAADVKSGGFPSVSWIIPPLGLGVRVPLLVVSPFSRGGHISTEVFDHTSQLQLISKRFGVEVPNVSAWRRNIVGDLTSTLFNSATDTSLPKLPQTSIVFASSGRASSTSQWTETDGFGPSIPTKQRMPNQSGGSEPAGTFFKLDKVEEAIPDAARTPIDISGPSNETVKSRGNRLLSSRPS